jgi:hypothetical protein
VELVGGAAHVLMAGNGLEVAQLDQVHGAPLCLTGMSICINWSWTA